MASTLPFLLLLFTVAYLYANVGHGGASGYLALMALFGTAPETMRPTALLLNLFVSLTAFLQFHRGGHFNRKIFLPFALASVPMSFLGGMLSVDAVSYKRTLGLLLLVPVARLLLLPNAAKEEMQPARMGLSLLIGAGIGFLSGLIGIGGGILLSPVLLMLKWTDQRQTAAVSALFIFVNSLAGLGGQLTKGVPFGQEMVLPVAIAFAGGLLGAWTGAFRYGQNALKYTLAGVLALASYKLLLTGA
jgi:uncharacterized membrane protein YfcA